MKIDFLHIAMLGIIVVAVLALGVSVSASESYRHQFEEAVRVCALINAHVEARHP